MIAEQAAEVGSVTKACELVSAKLGIGKETLARCQQLTTQINELERELRDLVRMLAPSL